ncbi:tripartite tricarboxylate transporter TctB family protein [Brachybacterium sacelli]|uniref:Tricarboxylic transport membrane protein n=1 Tax=Brachybacterium sacelli TaxID=173364 RepID=A0ABS4WXF3_9MICO|nr:tripartite tricarboxylate transporter TctB family protein [Brachybacterium sacelli]MBP2380894.1 putative tricarboxylic transport membrane protein [Brachybacterium sacelli]
MTQTAHEKREQLIFLAVMTVLGILAVVGGLGYGLELEGRVGPGVMPFAAGVLMLLTVAVQARRRLRAPVVEPAPAPADDAGPPDGPAPDARPDARLVALIFALIVLAVAATFLVGMLIAVSLLVGALFLVNDRTRPRAALIAAVTAGGFGWLVFATLLNVPLPTGLLGLI